MNFATRLSSLLTLALSAGMVKACPTCSVAQSFTPKTLLLSLVFASIPASLMVLLWYRVYREEAYKEAVRKLKENERPRD
jgi:hypothetical protein